MKYVWVTTQMKHLHRARVHHFGKIRIQIFTYHFFFFMKYLTIYVYYDSNAYGYIYDWYHININNESKYCRQCKI